MATISAAGIGSGLNVSDILSQIVEAERVPTENRLNLKEATLQAELSAFGSVKGAINTFQSSLSKLQTASLFNSSNVDVSNKDVLSATASSVAQEGSYSVEVKTLAQTHTLASIAFDELDDVIGSGTLTFSFGATDYDPGTDFATGDDTYSGFTNNEDRSSESIVIDNSNNTISGIRDAINEASIGVTASIVDDGSGYRLLITSDQQGLNNSLEIAVDEGTDVPADNIDTSGLSLLVFNSSATNIEQTQAAQDAEIKVNGLTVLRDSNSIAGVISGVTLNLKTVDVGNSVQVNVTNTNVEQTSDNITQFVNGFNELASTLNSLTKYDPDKGQNGVLLGDTTSRSILQQIRRELGGFIDNGGSYNSLSAIGITTKRDGTLEVDTTKLNKSLEQDFDSVAQLFYANGNVSDNEVTFQSSSALTKEGTYSVSIASLATQAVLTGETVSAPITIDSSNNSFSLLVNGSSTTSISISQAVYNDMDTLAKEMQNRINANSVLQKTGMNVTVSYASGAFQLTSSSYGSDSSLDVAIQNTHLGLTQDALALAGTDVSGSIGGLVATGSGRYLSGSGAASGLKLEVAGNITGNRGDVVFSRGIASRLDSLLSQFLSADGQLTAKTDSIDNRIKDIADQRQDLLKRVADIEERYRRQFSALDVLMGQLQTTSDYLEQQLDSLLQLGRQK